MWLLLLLLRGTIVNRTYGTHKNLYISLFLPTICGHIYYVPRNNRFPNRFSSRDGHQVHYHRLEYGFLFPPLFSFFFLLAINVTVYLPLLPLPSPRSLCRYFPLLRVASSVQQLYVLDWVRMLSLYYTSINSTLIYFIASCVPGILFHFTIINSSYFLIFLVVLRSLLPGTLPFHLLDP